MLCWNFLLPSSLFICMFLCHLHLQHYVSMFFCSETSKNSLSCFFKISNYCFTWFLFCKILMCLNLLSTHVLFVPKFFTIFFLVVFIIFFFPSSLFLLKCCCFSMIHNDEPSSKNHCKKNRELYFVDDVFIEGLSHLTPIKLSELFDDPTSSITRILPFVALHPYGLRFTTSITSKAFRSLFTTFEPPPFDFVPPISVHELFLNFILSCSNYI